MSYAVENIVPSGGRIVNTSSDNNYTGSYSILHPSNISITVISVLDPPVLDCPTRGRLNYIQGPPHTVWQWYRMTSIF